MQSEIIFTVEEDPEGGYTAAALGFSIFTQGETMAELREMVRDAVRLYFEGSEGPKVVRLHLVHDEVLAV